MSRRKEAPTSSRETAPAEPQAIVFGLNEPARLAALKQGFVDDDETRSLYAALLRQDLEAPLQQEPTRVVATSMRAAYEAALQEVPLALIDDHYMQMALSRFGFSPEIVSQTEFEKLLAAIPQMPDETTALTPTRGRR